MKGVAGPFKVDFWGHGWLAEGALGFYGEWPRRDYFAHVVAGEPINFDISGVVERLFCCLLSIAIFNLFFAVGYCMWQLQNNDDGIFPDEKIQGVVGDAFESDQVDSEGKKRTVLQQNGQQNTPHADVRHFIPKSDFSTFMTIFDRGGG
uniref:Uncharacterized protein n=1 Tax=Romanomermis culicivorax TaxID=13658 RepID=A0A915IUQ2_ROMCU